MNRRQAVVAIAVGASSLVVTDSIGRKQDALAGGWASLELVNPFQVAIVNVPTVFDAQRLQHGVHPIAGGLPAATKFVHEDTGEEVVVDMTVVSDPYAIVRGQVTLSTAGIYRMSTWQMGPEIELGVVQAVVVSSGDVVSDMWVGPDEEMACVGSDDSGFGVRTEILDGAFADELLGIATGQPVTWTNTSIVPHQIVFRDKALRGSNMLKQDDTFSVTFEEAGAFDYYCAPHPYMKGRVVVEEGGA